MKKSIKKIVSLLATATIVFSSVSALAAPKGWTTTLDISGQNWQKTVSTINTGTANDFQIFDFGGSITSLNNARANFDVTYETEGGRSYMKLVPKNPDTSIGKQDQINVYGDLFNKCGKTTGRQHFTFDFTIVDPISREQGLASIKARLDGDGYNYSLLVGNGYATGTMKVGIGNMDANDYVQHAALGGANGGNSREIPCGTWCRYYLDYDCYTNKLVAGIKNADTGEDIIGPLESTLTKTPYFSPKMSIPQRNNATFCIGDMKYWKDTFVCDNSSKAITADDTTVTAKVNMANDVSTDLVWYAYGNATWEDHTNTSEPMLILAQYDENDHFLGLTSKSLSGLLPRDTATKNTAPTMHEMSVSMDKADGYAYAKAFLWDSMSGLDAFSNAWTNK